MRVRAWGDTPTTGPRGEESVQLAAPIAISAKPLGYAAFTVAPTFPEPPSESKDRENFVLL